MYVKERHCTLTGSGEKSTANPDLQRDFKKCSEDMIPSRYYHTETNPVTSYLSTASLGDPQHP